MQPEAMTRNQWRSAEDTMSPEDVAKLNFQPFGNHVMVESIKPETVSPGGLHLINARQDRPVYRVLKVDPNGAHSKYFKNRVKPGDIVRSISPSGLTVPHELPRMPDGTRRRLFLLASDSFDCVFTNAKGWTDQEREIASDMTKNDPRTVFTQDVINRTVTDMISAEDAAKIGYQPLGSKIIVENAPFKAKTNAGLEIGGRGERVPAYRILKMDQDFEPLPHLKNLRVGDFIYLLMVQESDMLPHEIRDSQGKRRELFLVDMGLIAAKFPNMNWDEVDQFTLANQDENSVSLDFEDTVTSQEAVGQ